MGVEGVQTEGSPARPKGPEQGPPEKLRPSLGPVQAQEGQGGFLGPVKPHAEGVRRLAHGSSAHELGDAQAVRLGAHRLRCAQPQAPADPAGDLPGPSTPLFPRQGEGQASLLFMKVFQGKDGHQKARQMGDWLSRILWVRHPGHPPPFPALEAALGSVVVQEA